MATAKKGEELRLNLLRFSILSRAAAAAAAVGE